MAPFGFPALPLAQQTPAEEAGPYIAIAFVIGLVVVALLVRSKEEGDRREMRQMLEQSEEQMKARVEEEERRKKAKYDRGKKKLTPDRAILKQNEDDPYAHIAFGDSARKLGVNDEAAAAYRNALALGIPNLRDSGLVRAKYARVIRDSWEIPFDEDDVHQLRDENSEYQLREAAKELKRHLRADPEDIASLKTLLDITRELGKPTDQIADQLSRAQVRKRLAGGRASQRAGSGGAKDRTGISFENQCLLLFQQFGLRADTTKATGDGGIDIVAFSDHPLTGGKYVVQCKDWENPVGVPAVRDLLGAMTAENAVKGLLIASGTFTAAAVRFAEGERIDLIDGQDLEMLLSQVRR